MLWCTTPPMLWCTTPPMLWCTTPPMLWCTTPPMLGCTTPPKLYTNVYFQGRYTNFFSFTCLQISCLTNALVSHGWSCWRWCSAPRPHPLGSGSLELLWGKRVENMLSTKKLIETDRNSSPDAVRLGNQDNRVCGGSRGIQTAPTEGGNKVHLYCLCSPCLA